MRAEQMKVELSDDEAWSAVAARSRSLDGRLFYGVVTTRIYCRPSCPSRRPRRENVVYFGRARDAEAEGFRACRRCQPGSDAGTTTERRIRNAVSYIDAHLDERITLRQLGATVGLSPYHLQRAFTSTIGLSPRAYQDARRLDALKSRLREGDGVGRAVWRAGYGSSRGAYESASSGLGMTPGQYRNGAAGLVVRYSLHDSPFGRMIVGWTARGICAVMLGAADDALVADLRAEFRGAELAPDGLGASAWVQAVLDFLDGTSPGPVVPLDLHGSNFQLRVWSALREIPLGEVRSYKEVAAAIGAPRASRAVARACATNKAAVVVPCHRVVRTGGAPGGYRWGIELKRRLQEHERSLATKG